jgi:transcription elongation factor
MLLVVYSMVFTRRQMRTAAGSKSNNRAHGIAVAGAAAKLRNVTAVGVPALMTNGEKAPTFCTRREWGALLQSRPLAP